MLEIQKSFLIFFLFYKNDALFQEEMVVIRKAKLVRRTVEKKEKGSLKGMTREKEVTREKEMTQVETERQEASLRVA